MAGRNTLRYDDVGAQHAPFLIDASTITYDRTKPGGSSQVGLAVMLSADRTIALTNDGAPVLDKLILVEADGKATVQTDGYMDLPGGASATLTVSAKIVGALGASSARGYIRAVAAASASPTQAEVVDAQRGRGIIIDNDVTTAVIVKL